MSDRTQWLADEFAQEEEQQAIETEQIAAKNLAGRSEFTRGLLSGIDNLQATGHGFLGAMRKLTGDELGAQRSFEGYQEQMREAAENPRTVQKFFSADPKQGAFGSVENLGTWAAGTIGEFLPSLTEMALTSAAGAAIGSQAVPGIGPDDVVAIPAGAIGGFFSRGAIKQALAKMAAQHLKKGVSHKTARELAKRQLHNHLAKRGGAFLGTTIAGTAMEGGGMYGELKERGIDAPVSSLALGLVSGLSESAFGVTPKLNKIFSGAVRSKVADLGKRGLTRRAAGALWDSVGTEAGQEGFQEFLGSLNQEINDPEFRIATKEQFMNWAEASASGGLAGGMFGGASATGRGLRRLAAKTAERSQKAPVDMIDEGTLQPFSDSTTETEQQHGLDEGAETPQEPVDMATGQTVDPAPASPESTAEAEGLEFVPPESDVDDILFGLGAEQPAAQQPIPPEAPPIPPQAVAPEVSFDEMEVAALRDEVGPQAWVEYMRAAGNDVQQAALLAEEDISGEPGRQLRSDYERAQQGLQQPFEELRAEREITATPEESQRMEEFELARAAQAVPEAAALVEPEPAPVEEMAAPAEQVDITEEEIAATEQELGEVKPSKAEEPWMLTPSEYVEDVTDVNEIAIKKSAHPKQVKQALKEGRDVPVKVLEAYKFNKWARDALAEKLETAEPKRVRELKAEEAEVAPTPEPVPKPIAKPLIKKPAEPSKAEQIKKKAKEVKAKREAGFLSNLSEEKQARAEELKKKMQKKFGHLGVGIDPTLMSDGIELTVIYAEAGIRNFAEYAKNMIDVFGDKAKPYLVSWWQGAAEQSEFGDDMQDVTRKEAKAILKIVDKGVGKESIISKEEEPVDVDVRDERKPDVVEAPGVAGRRAAAKAGPTPEEGRDKAARKLPGQKDATGVGPGVPADTGRDVETRGKRARTERDRVPRDRDEPTAVVAKVEGEIEPVQEKPARLTPAEKNHRIAPEDVLIVGGDVSKTKANLSAIALLKKLQKADRLPSPKEKKTLAKYVGWGGLAGLFDKEKAQAHLIKAKRGYKPFGYDEKWSKKWGKYYEQLADLLTQVEIDAAARSVLNAHYTERSIIEGAWDLAEHLGFKGGRVGEFGAGVGHFMGLTPDNVAKKTDMVAVEMDKVTGGMLEKLYPQAEVHVKGLEDTDIPDNSLDMVIGNFPFHEKGPYDKAYPTMSLHNYFFARALDAVKPGGLVVAITSTGTMDSNIKQRRYLAERAELVGAVRLPDTTFKKSAGTEVVTDMIVLRKRDGAPTTAAQPWVETKAIPTYDKKGDVSINEYYAANPEMLLGRLALTGSMYRADTPNLEVVPGTDVKQSLDKAITQFPKDVLGKSKTAVIRDSDAEVGALAKGKEYSIQVKGGKVYEIRAGRLQPVAWGDNKLQVERAKTYVPVRENVKALISLEKSSEATDKQIEAQRKKLNDAYDKHVKKHGEFGNNRRHSFLSTDPEYPLVLSVEEVTPKTVKKKGRIVFVKEYSKGPIFTKRVQHPWQEPKKADNALDAAAISIAYRNNIDMQYVTELTGMTPDAAEVELLGSPDFYRNPQTGQIETRDEYLSGNVRKKLAEATESAKENPDYDRNVDALKPLQPVDKEIQEISLRLGSQWVPSSIYTRWVRDLFKSRRSTITLTPSGREGVQNLWSIDAADGKGSTANNTEYASGTLTAEKLITAALNGKQPTVYTTGPDGKSRVKDAEGTLAARAMLDTIRKKFVEWVKADKESAQELEKIYNEKFNAVVPRKYTQMYDRNVYPGASSVVDDKPYILRDYQRVAVNRILQKPTLLAHAVGAGKTGVMVTAAMEMKRMGLADKSLIVVQNSTIEQFSKFIPKLYPSAKVLQVTRKDMSAQNRKTFMSRVATGDYDIIVVSHSQFDLIPDDPARIQAHIRGQLDELEDAIREGAERDGKKSPGVKQLESAKKSLEDRLKKLLDRKVDDTVFFEDLGVDAVFLDEAHLYKKNFFLTQMENVKGLDTGFSQKASSLSIKLQHVRDKTGGKNIVLATGTPVTNTLAELWNMVRYVNPQILRDWGIEKFDEFATAFTQTVAGLEIDAAGRFRQIERFASFLNAPELATMFQEAADVILPEDLKDVPRPAIQGGTPQTIKLDRTPNLEEYTQFLGELYEWFENLSGKEKKENSHIPLVIFGLGRKSTVDMRLVDPTLPADPNSKLMRAASEITERYKKYDKEDGVQAVFLDTYRALDEEGKELFNAWDELKAELVRKGVPEDEIAVISDYSTQTKREFLFDQVNEGKIRVVIGSTPRMGIGANIQERLAALHHIDAPYRPADMEQREGRIIRQGNMFALPEMVKKYGGVEIVRYGVEKTLDAGMYQMLERKQRFINQGMKGTEARTLAEDNDSELSFAEASALFSGNPAARRKVGVDARVKELQLLERAHRRKKDKIAIDYSWKTSIAKDQDRVLSSFDKLTEKYKKSMDVEEPTLVHNGRSYKGKAAAEYINKLVDQAEKTLEARPGRETFNLTINGVEVRIDAVTSSARDGGVYFKYQIPSIKVPNLYTADGAFSVGEGLLSAVPRMVRNMPATRKKIQTQFKENAEAAAELKKLMDAPFSESKELDKLIDEQEQLNEELQSGEKPAAITGKPAWPQGGGYDSYRGSQGFEISMRRKAEEKADVLPTVETEGELEFDVDTASPIPRWLQLQQEIDLVDNAIRERLGEYEKNIDAIFHALDQGIDLVDGMTDRGQAAAMVGYNKEVAEFVTEQYEKLKQLMDLKAEIDEARKTQFREPTADALAEALPKASAADKLRIRNLVRKLLGAEVAKDLEFVDQVLRGAEPMVGSYSKGLIKIVDKQADPTDTAVHEAMHAAEDLLLTPNELETIDKAEPNAEKRANKFIEYVNSGKGVSGAIRRIFGRLLRRVKAFVKLTTDRDRLYNLYDKIVGGEIAERGPIREAAREAVQYREKPTPTADAGKGFLGNAQSWIQTFFGEQPREKGVKKDIGWLANAVLTPLYKAEKNERYAKLFEAGRGMSDFKARLENDIFQDDLKYYSNLAKTDPAGFKKVEQYLLEMDREAMGYKVKQNEDGQFEVYKPSGYKLKGIFKTEAAAWRAAVAGEVNDLITHKQFTQEQADAVAAWRRITNRTYDELSQFIGGVAKEMEAVGLDPTKIEADDGTTVDLFDALREMGDRRGHYFPRQRGGGRFQALAKKGNDVDMRIFDTPIGRRAWTSTMRHKGYAVTWKRTERPSEQAFLDLDLVAMNDMIQQALDSAEFSEERQIADLKDMGITSKKIEYKRKDGGVDDYMILTTPFKEAYNEVFKDFGGKYFEIQGEEGKAWHFKDPSQTLESDLANRLLRLKLEERTPVRLIAQALVNQIAKQVESRGSRAAKIGRLGATGEQVIRGYDEDSRRVISKYVKGVAGGTAKTNFAKQAQKIMTGTEESWAEYREVNKPDGFDKMTGKAKQDALSSLWEDYRKLVSDRRIDSAKQPNLYEESTSFTRELLRNEEPAERIMGVAKGLAAMKYLTGIAPGVVNLTAMVTNVPAAMRAYANIPLRKGLRYVGEGMKIFSQGLAHETRGIGGGIKDADMHAAYEEMRNRNYDEALFNREAMEQIQGKLGRGADTFMRIFMYPFAITERVNRGGTVMGIYSAMRDQAGKTEFTPAERADAIDKAIKITDKAHGLYGKVNRPKAVRGSGLGAQALQSAYTFKTYTHNYFQLLASIYEKKDHKALAYAILAPTLLGGAGAAIPVTVVRAVFSAFGLDAPDQPEEKIYGWLRDTMGEPAEKLARQGVPSLAGFNLSGSLAVDIGAPRSFGDFLGAPYSVYKDLTQGAASLMRGDALKGVERMLPRALGAPVKGYREWSEGVTTRTNQPVFYGEDRLKASNFEFLLRSLQFNPSNISYMRDRQWRDKRAAGAFSDRRTELYAQMRRALLKNDTGALGRTINDMEAYNAAVRRQRNKAIPLVTRRTIKSAVTRMRTPPRQEKIRAGLAERAEEESLLELEPEEVIEGRPTIRGRARRTRGRGRGSRRR